MRSDKEVRITQGSAQSFIVGYALWLSRWRWPVLIAAFSVALAAAWGLRLLEFTSDFRVYFGPENPELLAGFLVLNYSSFKINADLGVFTALTLVCALAVDFLFLPSLLMLIDREAECRCVTCLRERGLQSAE